MTSIKPTYEHAMEVHADMGRPSCRVLEKALRDQGYDISYRTLQRWIENGKPGQVAVNHAVKTRTVKREIVQALAKISDDEKLAADKMKVEGIAPAVQAEIAEGKCAGQTAHDAVQVEVNIIDQRIKDLLLSSAPELDLAEQKARKIFNIVLLEAAARRANVMTMIPKETAALVDAMTTASKQTLTGGIDQVPKAGDPRTIDAEAVDVTPKSPLASKISKFLHDEGMA